jgi:hypothetical protein
MQRERKTKGRTYVGGHEGAAKGSIKSGLGS